MFDFAHEWTDAEIERLQRRITAIYDDAIKDAEKKANTFWAKYAVKDKKHREDVKSGKWTEQDYQEWLQGQIFQGKQWENLKKRLVDDFSNADKIAYSIIRGDQDKVFAYNANYMAYSISNEMDMSYGFGVHDANTVKMLLKDDPDLLPKKYIRNADERKYVQDVIDRYTMQGILTGESIAQIAEKVYTGTNQRLRNYALTNARTAMTAAQNAGRLYTIKDCNERLGLHRDKVWLAMHDERTRDSHAEIDYEQVAYDEPFSNGLMYPGDPDGAPAEVYNCRCTMKSVHPSGKPYTRKESKEDFNAWRQHNL